MLSSKLYGHDAVSVNGQTTIRRNGGSSILIGTDNRTISRKPYRSAIIQHTPVIAVTTPAGVIDVSPRITIKVEVPLDAANLGSLPAQELRNDIQAALQGLSTSLEIAGNVVDGTIIYDGTIFDRILNGES